MRPVHRSIIRLAVPAIAAVLFARGAEAQVSVGGVVYTQYTFNVSDTLSSLNNFDVTRAYVNVNGQFAGGIRTRVTADVFNTGGAGGAHAFRLKYAYATWTPDGSALTYKMGAVQTPWLDWEEALWDYRMQGQMATERGGYVSSSDFGLGVDGRWNDDMFNFQAGIWNGENYSGTPGDKRKDFMARASYRVMGTDDGSRVGGLRLSAYGQVGQPNAGGTRQRWIGMVSYRTQNITLAAEYAMTKDSATAAATLAGFACPANILCSGKVFSIFGTYHFTGTRLAAIGRVDLYQTADSAIVSGVAANKDETKTSRIILGASYQLSPNVRVLLDYDALSYNSAYTPSPGQQVAKQVAALHAQFTF